MAKFKLFDESSWRPSALTELDIEQKITNKAIGAIGQIIHEVRSLKEKIEKNSELNQHADYNIAEALKQLNKAAYDLMGIQIILPEAEVSDVLKDINFILDTWNDTSFRTYCRTKNWQQLLPPLKRLQPYIEANGAYTDHRQEYINKLTAVKVVGNAAWDVYLKAQTERNYWLKTYIDMKEKYDSLTGSPDSSAEEDDES